MQCFFVPMNLEGVPDGKLFIGHYGMMTLIPLYAGLYNLLRLAMAD